MQRSELPSQIILPALNKNWRIEYQPAKLSKELLLSEQTDKLILYGNIKNRTLTKKYLRKWLHAQAKRYFKPWLDSLSQQTDLVYSKLSIRDNSTRWGSCSAKKNISLDYKLLFLAENLVRCVMIHELCHTQHLDHSIRFWHLFAQFEPNCKELSKELRKASHSVPKWL